MQQDPKFTWIRLGWWMWFLNGSGYALFIGNNLAAIAFMFGAYQQWKRMRAEDDFEKLRELLPEFMTNHETW